VCICIGAVRANRTNHTLWHYGIRLVRHVLTPLNGRGATVEPYQRLIDVAFFVILLDDHRGRDSIMPRDGSALSP
jgi:hypothetical protein